MSEEQTDDYIVNGEPENEVQPEIEETPDAEEVSSEEVSEESGGAGEDSEPGQVAETSFEDQLKAAQAEAFRKGEEQKQKEMVGAIASMREKIRKMEAGQSEPASDEDPDIAALDQYLDGLEGKEPVKQAAEPEPVQQAEAPQVDPALENAYASVVRPACAAIQQSDPDTFQKLAGFAPLDGLAVAISQIGMVVNPEHHLRWIADNPEKAAQMASLDPSAQIPLLQAAIKQKAPAPQQRVRPTGGVNTGGGGGSVSTGNGQRWGL